MFARTPRLLLRPGFAEDAPALAMAIGDDEEILELSDEERAAIPTRSDDQA